MESLINNQFVEDDKFRIKLIYKIKLKNHGTYVLKIVKEHEHPQKLIERQSEFSELLYSYGIDVPKRLKTVNGLYSYTETIEENMKC